MSYEVEVDTSNLQQALTTLIEQMGGLGEVLTGFLEDRIIPKLQAESASQRKVHTGTYSGTWEAQTEGEDGAIVTTDAEYWKYLEFGTGGKGRRVRATPSYMPTKSGGVKVVSTIALGGIKPKPVVGECVDAIRTELPDYLANALRVFS